MTPVAERTAGRAALARQREQLEALVLIQESLARLERIDTAAGLIAAAAREVRSCCGFSRVMISRVRGSMWAPYAVDHDEALVAAGRGVVLPASFAAEIPLTHRLAETEMVRRRTPLLVTHVPTASVERAAILDRAGVGAYVAAPITVSERVIGFLHADRYGQDRLLDAADRDTLWTFAEQFGVLFERVVILDRLDRQRETLREALTAAVRQVDDVRTLELSLRPRRAATASVAAATPTGDAGAADRPGLNAVLTRREREVLELLAAGHTNGQVAEALVISEGTVKSHVKRILRKLRVSSRAEAVARYLHFARGTDT